MKNDIKKSYQLKHIGMRGVFDKFQVTKLKA